MGIKSGFFDIASEMLGGMVGGRRGGVRYDVYESGTPTSYKSPEPQNMSTVYMCARILSSAMGSMPIEVVKEGKPDKKHSLYYGLRHRLSDLYNNQTIMSVLEYQVNIYGNALFNHKLGEIIPPETIDDWKIENGKMEYHVNWSKISHSLIGYGKLATNKAKKNSYSGRDSEWVKAKDVWHFKGLSVDGLWGLPTISAAMYNMEIIDKATSTIRSFYDNRAMSPMALSSTVDSPALMKATIEGTERFTAKYAGSLNAGKTMNLPPNTKLTPLSLAFADAQLIDTMSFSRDEICNMYGIPSFLYNSSDVVQMDIEQQSLNFRMFTINPKISIYKEEIAYKSLTKEEVLNGYSINFDTSVLIDTDMKAKANAFAKMIQSGIVSPNEASKSFGYNPSPSKYGDEKFVQAQLIALSDYGVQNPLIKGSTVNTKTDSSTETKIETDDKTDKT